MIAVFSPRDFVGKHLWSWNDPRAGMTLDNTDCVYLDAVSSVAQRDATEKHVGSYLKCGMMDINGCRGVPVTSLLLLQVSVSVSDLIIKYCGLTQDGFNLVIRQVTCWLMTVLLVLLKPIKSIVKPSWVRVFAACL